MSAALRQARPARGRERERLRQLKRAVRAGLAGLAGETSASRLRENQSMALCLLDRSIRFGHRRLALLRLRDAIRLQAAVSREQWKYCWKVVASSSDPSLRAVLHEAEAAALARGSPV